jgi:hypothetical protein
MRDGVVTEGCWVEFALTEDDLVAFASLPFARTPLLRLSVDFYRILVFVGTVAILLVAYAIFGDGRWWYDPQFRGSVIGYGFLAMVALVFLDRPLGVMLLRRRIRSGRYADFMRHRRGGQFAFGRRGGHDTLVEPRQGGRDRGRRASRRGGVGARRAAPGSRRPSRVRVVRTNGTDPAPRGDKLITGTSSGEGSDPG